MGVLLLVRTLRRSAWHHSVTLSRERLESHRFDRNHELPSQATRTDVREIEEVDFVATLTCSVQSHPPERNATRRRVEGSASLLRVPAGLSRHPLSVGSTSRRHMGRVRLRSTGVDGSSLKEIELPATVSLNLVNWPSVWPLIRPPRRGSRERLEPRVKIDLKLPPDHGAKPGNDLSDTRSSRRG